MLSTDDIAAAQRVAFETAPDPIVVLESDGTVALVNSAARDLPCRGAVLDALREDAEGLQFRVDLRSRGRASTEVRVAGRVVSIVGRTCASRVVLFLRDVTSVRQTEQDLVRLWGLASIGAFAASFVHDFGNLMSPLHALGDALAREAHRSGFAQAYVEELRRTTDSARELVSSVRGVVRGRPAASTDLSVNATIDKLRPLLERAVGPNISIAYALDGDDAHVTVDRVRFERAVLNLVVNARNAMPDGGRIVVRTFATLADGETYVGLSVTDEGMGMSVEECARAYEPGEGLGLWLVHRFARDAGGKVEILSELGEGTRVTVRLPRALATDPYRPRESTEIGRVVLDVGT